MNTHMLTNIMGSMGRKGDSMVAHLTPGDVVIPRDIILENPEFLTKFKKAMQDNRADYRTHIAGSGYEDFNPETGAPEFGFLSGIFKPIKKAIKTVSHGIQTGNIGDVIVGMMGGQGLNPLHKQIGGLLGASDQAMGIVRPPEPAPVSGEKIGPLVTPAPNLGAIDQPFTAKRPNEGTQPYDLFSRNIGGQTFGQMDPTQQRSYLATQGTAGGGLSDEDKNYYMNMLQRNLIDEGGQMGNINEALLPVERNYLSRMGLPTDNTQGFFQALQS